MLTPSHDGNVCFGPFELDLSCNELRKHGHRIRIQKQPLRVLALLVDRPGQLVTRDELRWRLWPNGLYVDFEHGLNRSVNKLRRALLDSADSPRYIETLPSLGYRFIAPVEVVQSNRNDEPSEATAPAAPVISRVLIHTPPPMPANIPSINEPRISRNLKRSVVISMVAAVLVSVASTIVWQKLALRPTTVGRTMVVVLPFENLTGDQGQDYFCEGMTEELITQLGNLDPDRLGVIARTTAMHYKGSSKTIKEIAGELGVSHVVEGSIRRVDSRIRVTTQLIQARDQRHLWAHSFDRESFDILSLQRDVSMIVAQELPSYLSISRQSHLQSLRPANSEAYLDYLKGRFFWNKRNKDDLDKSVSYFKKAIEEDPQYARAYAGLADVYLVLGGGSGPPHQLYKLGQAAAVRALAFDGDLAEAHTSLGFFKFIDEWDWPGADREFRRAISLDPGYATAHHWYAQYLSAMNRMPESIQEIEKALELDPLSTTINANVGAIYYQSGDYEKSLKQLQKTLELDPNFIPAYHYMAYVYEVTGRYEQALSVYTKAQKITGNAEAYEGAVSWLEALMGRKQGVQKLLERYRDHPEAQPPISAFTVCLLYSTLGNTDEALKWLQKAVDDREFTATELTHDLRIANLRADPRFEEIRRQFSIPAN